MNNEKKKHEEKILLSFHNNIKLHLILQDGSWRNGYVKKIKNEFFMFEDKVNGIEPIFLLDLKKVEPYANEKEIGK